MTARPTRLHAEPVRDWAALGREWEALEAEAPGAPFFRGWGWVGCLAEERFPRPLLLRAEEGGRTLGLALFNRDGPRLMLAESGDPARDAPFVEHNGPLLAEGAPAGLAAAMLRAAWHTSGARRLVLGGVTPGLAAEVGGTARRHQARPAPYVDLAAVRAAGGDWLATLSANARQQLRRSDRLFAGEAGEVAAREAATPGEAADFLAEMMELHARRWGGEGAYRSEWLRRFHRELAARALGRGEMELLRVTGAGGALVGLLQNFRRGGVVSAYQSGWAEPAGEGGRAKPGLTCHHAAIRRALTRGDAEYDFLAGDQRYKRSLSGAERELVWAERVRAWSAEGLVLRGAKRLQRFFVKSLRSQQP